MTKATHNGICQLCGRLQAVTGRGQIAKHGYKVTHGYFSGTCAGSDRLPLQVSRELLDATLAGWEFDAEQMDQDAAAILAGTKKVTRVHLMFYGKSAWDPARGTKLLTREEAQALNRMAYDHYEARWDEAAKQVPYNLRREAQNIRSHIAMMLKLAEKTFGTPLVARVA